MPSLIELLHLRPHFKHLLYCLVDFMARTTKRPGEDASPQDRLNRRFSAFLGTASWRESTQSDFSGLDRILFNFTAATSVDGVSLIESGKEELGWYAYFVQTVFGGCALAEESQDERMLMRINVACFGAFNMVRQMIEMKLM